MSISYFCAYHSLLETIDPLSDAERGRLFTACLQYSRTGEVPELSGNERYIFPGIKGQIDRDKAKYDDRRQKASESANARWRRDECERMRTDANACERIQTHAIEKEKEKEKEIIKEKELPNGSSKEKKPSIDDDFAQIWKEYPKKQGRDQALKAYAKARKEGVTDETILEGIKAYKRYIAAMRIEDRYVKQGGTWFYQQCWEDDYTTTGNASGKTRLQDRHNYDYAKIEEELFGEG